MKMIRQTVFGWWNYHFLGAELLLSLDWNMNFIISSAIINHHYEFCRGTPFGLKGAGYSFQWFMSVILGESNFTDAVCYLDDVLVRGPIATWEVFMSRIRHIMERIAKAGLALSIRPRSAVLVWKRFITWEPLSRMERSVLENTKRNSWYQYHGQRTSKNWGVH